MLAFLALLAIPAAARPAFFNCVVEGWDIGQDFPCMSVEGGVIQNGTTDSNCVIDASTLAQGYEPGMTYEIVLEMSSDAANKLAVSAGTILGGGLTTPQVTLPSETAATCGYQNERSTDNVASYSWMAPVDDSAGDVTFYGLCGWFNAMYGAEPVVI